MEVKLLIHDSMGAEETKLVLFDGVCNLCNGVVQFIIRIDKKGRFKLASLQSRSGQEVLKNLGLPTTDFDTFVYVRGTSYFTKSTGALNLLKDLGGLWQAWYVFIFIPKPIRDFFYDLVAKYRYRILGKKESCMLPTPEVQQRFLT